MTWMCFRIRILLYKGFHFVMLVLRYLLHPSRYSRVQLFQCSPLKNADFSTLCPYMRRALAVSALYAIVSRILQNSRSFKGPVRARTRYPQRLPPFFLPQGCQQSFLMDKKRETRKGVLPNRLMVSIHRSHCCWAVGQKWPTAGEGKGLV